MAKKPTTFDSIDDLPPLKGGRLPTGRPGGNHKGGVDAKTARLIQCMLIGTDAEVEDSWFGTIPAHVPLSAEHAARVVGMSVKRARRLQLDPVFRDALKTATTGYYESQEPANFAVALSIRDNPDAGPWVRLAAIDYLRGPAPVSARPRRPRKRPALAMS